GPSEELFRHPLHPYTAALLSSIPLPNPEIKRERIVLQGEVPSPANPPCGCRFHPRCPFAQERCKGEVPALTEIMPNQQVACHFPLASKTMGIGAKCSRFPCCRCRLFDRSAHRSAVLAFVFAGWSN